MCVHPIRHSLTTLLFILSLASCTSVQTEASSQAASGAADQSNSYLLRQAVGTALAFNVDGVNESITEFNGVLSLNFPIYRVGHYTGTLRYRSGDPVVNYPRSQVNPNLVLVEPNRAGFPLRWSSTWTARITMTPQSRSSDYTAERGGFVEHADGNVEQLFLRQIPEIFNGFGPVGLPTLPGPLEGAHTGRLGFVTNQFSTLGPMARIQFSHVELRQIRLRIQQLTYTSAPGSATFNQYYPSAVASVCADFPGREADLYDQLRIQCSGFVPTAPPEADAPANYLLTRGGTRIEFPLSLTSSELQQLEEFQGERHANRLVDPHGNATRFIFYEGSDIPRVIESTRRDANGEDIVTARAFVYLEGNVPTGIPVEPTDNVPPLPNQLVAAVYYPGPNTPNPLVPDGTWQSTRFEYTPAASILDTPRLVRIVLAGQTYSIRYVESEIRQHVVGSDEFYYPRIAGLDLPHGSTTDYEYQDFTPWSNTGELLDEQSGVGVRRLTVRSPEGSPTTSEWRLTHHNTTETRENNTLTRYNAAIVNHPTGAATIRYFHPVADRTSPLSARTGAVAIERFYEAPVTSVHTGLTPVSENRNGYAEFIVGRASIVPWQFRPLPYSAGVGLGINEAGTQISASETIVTTLVGALIGLAVSVLGAPPRVPNHMAFLSLPAYQVTTRFDNSAAENSCCWSGIWNGEEELNCISPANTPPDELCPPGTYPTTSDCTTGNLPNNGSRCFEVRLAGESVWCETYDHSIPEPTCPSGTTAVSTADCQSAGLCAPSESDSIIRVFRQGRRNVYFLHSFADNDRADYDEFGNPAFVREIATSSFREVTAGSDCVARCEDNHCSYDWSCFHDEVFPNGIIEDARETRLQYAYEAEDGGADYVAQNITSLPTRTRLCELGSLCNDAASGLLSETRSYYDNRGTTFPFADAVGDAANTARGRLTSQFALNLEDPARSARSFYRYYDNATAADHPPGAIAETAVLTDEVSGEYLRLRASYTAINGSLIRSERPTSTTRLLPDGSSRDLGGQQFNAWGQTVLTRDANGLTTHFCFDNVGRPRATFTPEDTYSEGDCTVDGASPIAGASTEVRYFDEPGDYRQEVISRLHTVPFSTQSVTFLDSLSRPIQTRTTRRTEQGAVQVIAQSSDYFGTTDLVEVASEPYVTEGSVSTFGDYRLTNVGNVRNEYTSIGTVTRQRSSRANQSEQSTTVIRHGYNSPGLSLRQTETIDAQGLSTIETRDIWGRTISTRLPDGNELRTQYDRLGRLISITHPDGMSSTRTYNGLGHVVSETTPEAGTMTAQYDLVGLIRRETDATGQVLTYEYDALRRPTRVLRNGQPFRFYTYDNYEQGTPGYNSPNAINRLTTAVSGDTRYVYSYDALGRITEQQTSITGLNGPKRLLLTYTEDGQVAVSHYQPGQGDELRITSEFDANRAVARLNSSYGPLAAFRYTPLGDLAQTRLRPAGIGNGALQYVDYQYGEFGELRAVNNPSSLGTDAFAYRLRTDDPVHGGQVRRDGYPSEVEWARRDQNPAAYVIGYDSRRHVTSADYREFTGNAWTNPAQYDFSAQYSAIGATQRLGRHNAQGVLSETLFNYDTNGRRLLNTTGGVNTDLAYDPAGRLSQSAEWGQNSLVRYNAAGRTRLIRGNGTAVRYGYDDAEYRVSAEELFDEGADCFEGTSARILPGHVAVSNESGDNAGPLSSDQTCYRLAGQRHFVRGPSGEMIAEYLNGRLQRHYLGGIGYAIPTPTGLSAPLDVAPGVYFTFTDQVGSLRAVLHQSGELVEGSDFDPFGLLLEGTSYTTESELLYPRSFGGYRREHNPANFDFAGARIYHPGLGRFLSPDPLEHLEPETTSYAYARNSPLAVSDPTGLSNFPTGALRALADEITYWGGWLPEVLVTAPRIIAAAATPAASAVRTAGLPGIDMSRFIGAAFGGGRRSWNSTYPGGIVSGTINYVPTAPTNNPRYVPDYASFVPEVYRGSGLVEPHNDPATGALPGAARAVVGMIVARQISVAASAASIASARSGVQAAQTQLDDALTALATKSPHVRSTRFYDIHIRTARGRLARAQEALESATSSASRTAPNSGGWRWCEFIGNELLPPPLSPWSWTPVGGWIYQ